MDAIKSDHNGYGLLVSLLLIFPQLFLTINFLGKVEINSSTTLKHFEQVEFETADELIRYFARFQYNWPPGDKQVPKILVKTIPRDLGRLPVRQKKTLFFKSLLPSVLLENTRIEQERGLLQRFRGKSQLHNRDLVLLKRITAKYGMADLAVNEHFMVELLRRVDTIPPSLVLAQAVNESAWGTSRFSREANNLFGEWTYRSDQGLVPRKRKAGENHYVRKFNSVFNSVASYMNNLNRGHAYVKFRQLRHEARKNSTTVDAVSLAATLDRYSSRGMEYVKEIQSIIKQNRLRVLVDETGFN